MKRPRKPMRRRSHRDPESSYEEAAENYYAGRRDIQAVMKPGAKLTDYGRGMRDAIKEGRYS